MGQISEQYKGSQHVTEALLLMSQKEGKGKPEVTRLRTRAAKANKDSRAKRRNSRKDNQGQFQGSDGGISGTVKIQMKYEVASE